MTIVEEINKSNNTSFYLGIGIILINCLTYAMGMHQIAFGITAVYCLSLMHYNYQQGHQIIQLIIMHDEMNRVLAISDNEVVNIARELDEVKD